MAYFSVVLIYTCTDDTALEQLGDTTFRAIRTEVDEVLGLLGYHNLLQVRDKRHTWAFDSSYIINSIISDVNAMRVIKLIELL